MAPVSSRSGLPELLAPAGSWQALKAAVANGADAVYFGVEIFNARLRAENFQRADLPQVMEWLHRRGVQGFLTLNVLVFPDELEQAGALLLEAAAAGVDAVIIQDLGLACLASSLTPGLALHGSTQMSITSAAGVAMAAQLGCQRVVLARELTLSDLQRLQRQLRQRQLSMPLEVFVHGALCVAYSGQCLTSEALGQRSANRGECAQACRLPYQLIVDGEEKDLGEQRYLLSPQDLAAWDLLPQLHEAGIASLKIEGRLKDPAYVAAVTQAYRQGLDRLSPQPGDAEPIPARQLQQQLELSFSRGLSHGWLDGINHRRLVHGRWSKKRGPWLGRLVALQPGGGLLLPAQHVLKPGDGVVLEVPSQQPMEPPREIGGRVMAVVPSPGHQQLVHLGPGPVDLRGLTAGSPCWLTSDPSVERELQRLAQQDSPERRLPLRLQVSGAEGQPLQLLLQEAPGLRGGPWILHSVGQLEPASGQGLNQSRLREQLGRLGAHPGSLSIWRSTSLESSSCPSAS
jgi:putative protease